MKPHRLRRGNAAIEFALALPFLLVALLAIATMGTFGLTRMDTTIAARYNAWSGKDTPWVPRPERVERELPLDGLDTVGRILGPKPVWAAERGLLDARVTSEVPVLIAPLRYCLKEVDFRHAVLAGTWDHRVIAFPNDRREHPRLWCVRKYRCFPEGRATNLAAFGGLLAW